MKKIVLTKPYTIEMQEVDVPTISAEQVLIRVKSIGICGSDMQMYHGLHKFMTYPVTPGHEVGGLIEQVGSKVQGFAVGDRVTVEPQISCGECYPCKIGRFNVCEHLSVMGVHTDGFAAEYVAVDAKYLHLCPASLSFDEIALVEPLAVGVGSIKRASYKDANIAVIGAGTIGNLIAQSAQALGAGNVLVSDILESKLAFADTCGIKNCANTKDVTLAEAIETAFGSRGADVIVDAAANKYSFDAALEVSRPSSEIVFTGNYKEPMMLEIPRIQRREVNIIGHMMYVREDFADAIRFITEGAVKLDGMVTKRFAPEQFNNAFQYIDDNPAAVMKVMIDFDKATQ